MENQLTATCVWAPAPRNEHWKPVDTGGIPLFSVYTRSMPVTTARYSVFNTGYIVSNMGDVRLSTLSKWPLWP
jgi:hypothetical protein